MHSPHHMCSLKSPKIGLGARPKSTLAFTRNLSPNLQHSVTPIIVGLFVSLEAGLVLTTGILKVGCSWRCQKTNILCFCLTAQMFPAMSRRVWAQLASVETTISAKAGKWLQQVKKSNCARFATVWDKLDLYPTNTSLRCVSAFGKPKLLAMSKGLSLSTFLEKLDLTGVIRARSGSMASSVGKHTVFASV